MHNGISLLIEILQKEKAEYEKILMLSKKETKTIQEGNPKEIEEITQKQNEILSRCEDLQKQREKVVLKIKESQEKQDVTLSDLIECLENPWQRDEIIKIQKDLKRITTQQSLINRTNNALLRSNMEYVQFAIKVLQESLASNFYTPVKNSSSKTGNSSFIDQKA